MSDFTDLDFWWKLISSAAIVKVHWARTHVEVNNDCRWAEAFLTQQVQRISTKQALCLKYVPFGKIIPHVKKVTLTHLWFDILGMTVVLKWNTWKIIFATVNVNYIFFHVVVYFLACHILLHLFHWRMVLYSLVNLIAFKCVIEIKLTLTLTITNRSVTTLGIRESRRPVCKELG